MFHFAYSFKISRMLIIIRKVEDSGDIYSTKKEKGKRKIEKTRKEEEPYIMFLMSE